MRHEPLSKAIERAGSVKALAAVIGIRPQGVSQWTRIPADHVPAISRAFDIPRHELRPDLWDAPGAIPESSEQPVAAAPASTAEAA